MIKSAIHFICKIVIALVVYVLAFIADVLSLIGGLFRMVSGAVQALPVACIGFLMSSAVAVTIYFFVGANAAEDIGTQTAIFWMWVFAILAAMLLAFLGTVATNLALIVLAFANPGNLSGIFSAVANILTIWYIKLEKGEREPWISMITFPEVVRNWGGMAFSILSHGIAWLGTPALFAWMGHSLFFAGPEAVVKGTPDFGFAVVICVLIVIGGLFIGGAASLYLVADTAEE